MQGNSTRSASSAFCYEIEKYKDIEKRRAAFANVIQNKAVPLNSQFAQWDYIRKAPICEMLAEQGLIPFDSLSSSLRSRHIAPNRVKCIFCKSEFTVKQNMNPLAQHLTRSAESSPGICPQASAFLDCYRVDQNPFSQDLIPDDDPGISLAEPSGAVGGASGRIIGAEEASSGQAWGGSARDVEDDKEGGYQSKAEKLEKGICDLFKNIVFGDKKAKCSRFVRYIMDSHPDKKAVDQLVTFLNKLWSTEEKKDLDLRLAMKTVLEAFEHDSSLVGEICALAGTIEDSCIDRRTEVLDRMLVRCSLHGLYQLPEGQAMYWSNFLLPLKRMFHEEVFDNTFNHFRYGPFKHSLLSHEESSEIRGFYKHLLRLCCEFSADGFGLAFPGHLCPSKSVFYDFQTSFLKEIENRKRFFEFVFRTLSTDYDTAFEFIRLHDEEFNHLIQKADSLFERQMEELELQADRMCEGAYASKSREYTKKRDSEQLQLFKEYLLERVQKNWDFIQEKTIKGRIKKGMSIEKLKSAVRGGEAAEIVFEQRNNVS